MINFQIAGLPAEDFAALFAMDTEALSERRMKRLIVDEMPGYPCRVSLQDAAEGETVLLLPYQYQAANSPYRSSGPIFVREAVSQAILPENTVPQMLRHRMLSVRGYDAHHIMIAARVTAGTALEEVITALFLDEAISYLHIHNAGPGCFNCRVDRS